MEQGVQVLPAILISLCFGFSVGFYVIGRSRIQYKGMGWWNLALLLEGAGFLLLSLYGLLAPLFSVILANMLIVSGFMGVMAGVNAFYGREKPRLAISLFILTLFAAFLYYFTYMAPSVDARIIIVSITFGVMALATAVQLSADTPNVTRATAYFVLSGFVLFALFYFMRAWNIMQTPVADSAEVARLHEMTLVVFIVLTGWFSFGFVWMALYRTSMDMQTLMKIDTLTGAYMRRALFDILSDEMQRAERNGRPLSIVMMDLDHFKRLNDTLGHVMGDVALKKSVETVLQNIRIFDKIGRYGGEEFIVVLPETEGKNAMKVAERLRLAVASISIGSGTRQLPVTASFGVTQLMAGDTREGLIERVDSALYRAKEGGRNRVVEG
jgi:diguanylate cyclase (GGDEF)-like protein